MSSFILNLPQSASGWHCLGSLETGYCCQHVQCTHIWSVIWKTLKILQAFLCLWCWIHPNSCLQAAEIFTLLGKRVGRGCNAIYALILCWYLFAKFSLVDIFWGKRVGRGYRCVAPSYRPTHHLPKNAQGLPWAPIFLTLASEHKFFGESVFYEETMVQEVFVSFMSTEKSWAEKKLCTQRHS